MPSRYTPGQAMIPLDVFQSIARDPKGFEETIARYVKAKAAAGEAESKAGARKSEVEGLIELFEKDKAKAEKDIAAEKDKLAREWVRLEARVQDGIKEKARLSEIAGALDATKSGLDTIVDEQKSERGRLDIRSAELDALRTRLEKSAAVLETRIAEVEVREETLKNDVADLKGRIAGFQIA